MQTIMKRIALSCCGLALLGMTMMTQAVQAAGYTETRYPIVLVHGLAGYDDIFGVIQYFNGIPETLERYGATVHVAHVAAANSTEFRGEQLLSQVEDILAITGAEKVNLVGHSHGSMTARYVAGLRPELVASVSSVGGVNWGSAMADVLGSSRATMGLVDAFASIIDLMSGGGFPQDAAAAAQQMSTEGSEIFNQTFSAGIPSTYCGSDGAHEVDGVRYYSWGGDRLLTNVLDISDSMLLITGQWFGEPKQLLPEAQQQVRRQATRVIDLQQQVAALRAAGGSDAEVFSIRQQQVGAEAASRLTELDQQRSDWSRRVDSYRRDKSRLLANSGLAPGDQAEALRDLRNRYFRAQELKRVEVLDQTLWADR